MLSTETTRLVGNKDQSYQNLESGSTRNGLVRHNPFESDIYEGQNNGDYDRKSELNNEKPTCVGDCFKSIVFGGIDGLMSTLMIISGGAGGKFSWRIIVILGIANLAANSCSMGISEFLSSKAHREFLLSEKRREMWEFKHYKDVETNEMIRRFESRGMAHKDAELVVSKLATYEDIFVGLMLSEELGLQVPNEDDAMLLTDAFIMFLSFASLGICPLIILCLGPMNLFSDQDLFYLAIALSLVMLFILGSMKSSFSTASWTYSGLESLILGAICSFLAFFVGASVINVIAYI